MKHEEDALQIQCVQWFKMQYPTKIIMAIPNGGFRNIREAARFKKMGVLAGVSDLFIPSKDNKLIYPGLWIELKSKKGKPTEHQLNFIYNMRIKGYAAECVNTFELFTAVVNSYFKGSYEPYFKGKE